MTKEMLKAKSSARNKCGDGKTPNLYWVSASNDWLTNVNGFKSGDGNFFDGSSEVYKTLNGEYQIFGPFKTFTEAKIKFDSLCCLDLESPESNNGGLHSAQIEDRISGTIYEGVYQEFWRKKEYRGKTIESVSFSFDIYDDTRFTREKIEKSGAIFV